MPGVFRTIADVSLAMLGGQPLPDRFDRAIAVDEGFGPYTIEVPTGTTDQSIIVFGPQGLTTVTALAITSDQNISVTLGATGSNVAFPLNANGKLILQGTSLTAVALDNASGATANVTYVVAGT